ncbi:MAG: lipopolysaccharide biosynthesis protein, partial [Muribaculaceae bacterium]|nr:lipopolysaccharide biosynthesis protein [Muribaculaceae bacterium]
MYLYFRQLVVMALSLYTSRLVLQVLGVDDYGIYSVIGGTVAMLWILSGSLSGSIGRFVTCALGRRDTEEIRKIIATSAGVQIIMAVAICVIAETAGIWFVIHRLVIPEGRELAAIMVLQSGIVSFVAMLLSAPYIALVVAHERLHIVAMVGIGETLTRLVGVGLLLYAKNSYRLEIYSWIMAGISVGVNGFYICYSLRCFSESRVMPCFRGGNFRDMGAFAGWNSIGSTAALLRDQGGNILLNLFYGPVVNAARAIAMSVGITASAFSDNFMTALRPQITKSYAAGDTLRTLALVEQGARLGYCLTFVVVLPLLLITPTILHLWLGEYPEWTVTFVRLTLIGCQIDVLSSTLITLQVATGRIRNYQIVVGGLMLLNFPLSYLALRYGSAPWVVYVIAIIISMLCLYARLWFLRSMASLSIENYLRCVLQPVTVVTLYALPLPLLLLMYTEDSGSVTIIIGCISLLSAIVSVWFFGLRADEH